MTKYFTVIKKHKLISLVILVATIGAGYDWYSSAKANPTATRYLTAPVTRGILISSVSGSGQVSVSRQLDIKAKVAGDITKVFAQDGQAVRAGDLIARIDAADADKSVRDAQASWQSAQLSYDKFVQPAADLIQPARNSAISAQTSLAKLKLSQPVDYQNAQNNLRDAQAGLDKSYTDAFNSISSVFLNLPNIITALKDILYSEQISASETSLSQGQINTSILLNSTFESDQLNLRSYQAMAEADYASAQTAYDANYQNFKTAGVYSDPAVIKKLVAETLAAVKAIAQAIKSENNYLISWSDFRNLRNWPIFTQATTYKNNLAAYAGQNNSNLSNMLSAQNAIISGQSSVVSANDNLKALIQNQPLDLAAAEATLKEKQASLKSLIAGPDPLDLKSQQLSLQQKRNSLADAQKTLADYTIKAPFDGLLAKVNVKAGDSAAGTVIATVITKQQIAEIALNEIDVSKIKIGDKVNLTFDAVEGLSISARIAGIDSLGAVSQGVVTYKVIISFDTQDSRIKPGMTVNAVIITDALTDVLLAPNSAIKSSAGVSYVQILDATGQPQNLPVQVGVANDTDTEITGGLIEGQQVIIQIITSGATTAASPNGSAAGGFRIPGITGGAGGGNFRRIGN